MQILLANAKLMRDATSSYQLSQPLFQTLANGIATEMATKSTEEIARMLWCSTGIAKENWLRFQNYFSASPMPAIMAYNGQAYKHLRAESLSQEELDFSQHHLWITCFLYGMLRPLDAVVPYRMEHNVRLKATAGQPLSHYWRDKLTDRLIESVREDDGILVHLSTAEYEQLFDWRRVCEEVKVIQPLFYVRQERGMRVQAVWAKACRGAMVRHILTHRPIRQRHCRNSATRDSLSDPISERSVSLTSLGMTDDTLYAGSSSMPVLIN